MTPSFPTRSSSDRTWTAMTCARTRMWATWGSTWTPTSARRPSCALRWRRSRARCARGCCTERRRTDRFALVGAASAASLSSLPCEGRGRSQSKSSRLKPLLQGLVGAGEPLGGHATQCFVGGRFFADGGYVAPAQVERPLPDGEILVAPGDHEVANVVVPVRGHA